MAVAAATFLKGAALVMSPPKFHKLCHQQNSDFWSKAEALSCWCAPRESERVCPSPSRIEDHTARLYPRWGGRGGRPRKFSLGSDSLCYQTNEQDKFVESADSRSGRLGPRSNIWAGADALSLIKSRWKFTLFTAEEP